MMYRKCSLVFSMRSSEALRILYVSVIRICLEGYGKNEEGEEIALFVGGEIA